MPDGPRRATMKVPAAATLAGGPDDGTYPDDRPSRSHRPRRNSRARVAGETTHASWDPRAAGRGRRQPRRLARNRQAGSARVPAAARPPHRALIKARSLEERRGTARSGLLSRLRQQAREIGRRADHGPVPGIDVEKRDGLALRQLGHPAAADPLPGLGRGELGADEYHRDVIATLVGEPDHSASDPFRYRDRSR